MEGDYLNNITKINIRKNANVSSCCKVIKVIYVWQAGSKPVMLERSPFYRALGNSIKFLSRKCFFIASLFTRASASGAVDNVVAALLEVKKKQGFHTFEINVLIEAHPYLFQECSGFLPIRLDYN